MSDEFKISCPSCGSGTLRFTLTDVANRRTKSCSRGCHVQLEDEGGGARKVDRAMKDLDAAIRRLNRRIG